MQHLYSTLLAVHVVISLSLIGMILLQHGKGADMGAAFGSGSAGSLFGSRGSATFLSRTTAVLATSFFLTSMGLAWLATNKSGSTGSSGGASVIDSFEETDNKIPVPPAIDGSDAQDSSTSGSGDIPQ